MKKVVVPVVLVVGIGVSIYLWSTMESADAGDSSVMDMKQDYTCNSCKQQFSLTQSEATDMRRSRGDIYCPHCGQPSAAKHGVKVNLGAPSFKSDDEEGGQQGEEKVDPKPRAGGGAQKIDN